MGRLSAFVILAVATVLAIWFTQRKLGVFDVIQNVGAWVAAPIAAVFLLGRAMAAHHGGGGHLRPAVRLSLHRSGRVYLFKHVSWLMPFDNWLNRTFLVWATSMVLLVVVSLFTPAPDPEKIKGIIWSWRVAKLPESERERNRGLRNLFLWWGIFIAVMAALYGYVIWFQFWGPAGAQCS